MFKFYLLQLVSSISRQSVTQRIRTTWLKVWMTVCWFSGMIITIAYTCNLAAYLTITVPAKSIQSIDKLAASEIK